MDPIRFAIDNPVKVSVGVILVVVFGLVSLLQIPVQLTPNVDQPVISVTTDWQGASPEEIEQDVVLDQEDKLQGIPGLQKMTSVCQQGQASIRLEFPVGTDKDVAFREVSEKLRQVKSYPDNVDEPVVEASDPQSRDYIAWIILRSTDPDFDVRQLQKFAEDNVKTELERVKGVSEVQVLGGAEPEIHVIVDPVALAARKISPMQLAQKLSANNLNTSAGDLRQDKLNYRIRAIGRPVRTDQVEQIILSDVDAPVVRVMDIGRVVQTYEEPFAIVRSNGKTSLAINVQREVGSNVMFVMQGLHAAIDNVNKNVLPNEANRLHINGDLILHQVYDQTVYIRYALQLVRNNLFVGGTLAVLVLILFLRSIRPTLIIALAIPVSVIGTFVAIVVMGRNINVISLAGLAFAVGMVVDNAIVVLENIDRHQRLGERPAVAAYRGAKEVWGAVLASTLTTLAVFLPILTIQEEAGQLFRDISLAICASVTLSLIVSVTVIPSAAKRFLVHKEPKDHTRKHPIDRAASGFVNGVSNLIYWLMGTWGIRMTIILLIAGSSLLLSYFLMPPSSYLPTGNQNLVFSIMIPPPGYSLEHMLKVGERVEGMVRPYWEAKLGEPSAANLPPIPSFNLATMQLTMEPPVPIDQFFFVGLRSGQMFGGAISADDTRVDPVGDLLSAAIQSQPGIWGAAFKQPLIRTSSAGSAISLEITGRNMDEIVSVAQAVMMQCMQTFGFASVRPDPGNFNIPGPEVQVVLDRVRAAELGLTDADMATIAPMLGDGTKVGEYPYEGDNIDMKLIADNKKINDPLYIRDVPIATSGNIAVPLSSFTTIKRTTAPQQINRIERQRAVALEITLPDNVPLEDAMNTITNKILQPMRDSGQAPDTVSFSLAGTAAKLKEVKRALLGEWTGFNLDSLLSLATSRALFALLITYLLMAALFESWFHPFVIMFTVPLATVGGFLGLRIVHTFIPNQQLDVLTMLGFVILIGVVVNNAILIVHQALNFMRGEAEADVNAEGIAVTEKLPPRKAIAESVRTRIRPIFMSTLTSVLGMLPLVLFPGAGSELYRGLGSVMVGGLLLGTVFTVFLVPLVMSVVFDLSKHVSNLATAALGSTKD